MADLASLVISVDSTPVARAGKDLDSLSAAGGRAESSTQRLGRSFATLAAAIGAAAVAKHFYDTNAEFQRLNANIQTLVGSQAAAQGYFDMLVKFAQTTPAQLQEVVRGFTVLRARGLDATEKSMMSIMNMASAMGYTFEDTIAAMNSAIAGETEPLRRLGFSFSVTGDKARIAFGDITKTVDRTGQSIQKALAEISDAKFGDAAARQMKTLGGAMSNLQDQIAVTLAAMGNGGANQALTDAMRGITQAIADATPALAAFADTATQKLTASLKFLWDHRDAVLAIGLAYTTVQIAPILARWTTAAMDAVAAMQKAAAVSYAMQGMVLNLGGSLKTTSTSATMLKAAMTALGGPITIIAGLLVAAAGAWILWGSKAKSGSEEAAKGLKDVNDQMEREIKLRKERKRIEGAKTAEEARPDAQIQAEAEALAKLKKEKAELARWEEKINNVQLMAQRGEMVLREITRHREMVQVLTQELDRAKALGEQQKANFKEDQDAKSDAEKAYNLQQKTSEQSAKDLLALQQAHKLAEQKAKFDRETDQLARSIADSNMKLLGFTQEETDLLGVELERLARIKDLKNAMAKEEYGPKGSGVAATREAEIMRRIELDAKLKGDAIKHEVALREEEAKRVIVEQELADINAHNAGVGQQRLDQLLALKDSVQQNRVAQDEYNKALQGLSLLHGIGAISEREFGRGRDEATRKLWQQKSFYTEAFGEMGDTIRHWADSGAQAFADFAMSGKFSIRDMVNSMLKDLARLAAQKMMTNMIASFMPSGSSGVGGGGISSGAGSLGASLGSAASVYTPPSASAAPSAAPISFSVNVDASGGVSTEGDMGANAKALGTLVGAKVMEVLVREKRPGGLLMASR